MSLLMTSDEHKARHLMLHRNLDELLADWLTHEPTASIDRPLIDLMKWSCEQTKEPTPDTVRTA